MRRLGLTGSIGMGKSTTAAMFARRGVPVHDADKAVHRLYRGAAAAPIAEVFPQAVRDGIVDRPALSKLVVGDAPALKRLEAIVHPLVRAEEERFVASARAAGADLVLLDIPLLFEAGGIERIDAIIVASADAETQARRVLARPGMTCEIFRGLLARQVADGEKRARAHFIIDTGRGIQAAERQVDGILRALRGRPLSSRG
jgi:dephospho-CoA kinase